MTVVRTIVSLLAVAVLASSGVALSQTRVLQIAYTPTKRAQVAVWLEAADGTFLQTVMITEAVGLRGIGNRPGALQMNSGFRWPYGRREGVLPVWAHRRAAAAGAQMFPRVIFQLRAEGKASQTSSDNSPDPFYCLSFNDLQNDNVDTVTCASVFNSDKGRYMTPLDVQNGYAEPFDVAPGMPTMRPLSLMSLYPMRRDIVGGVEFDTPDTLTFASVARTVMPDIDAVTRATAPADTPQLLSVTLPATMLVGDYVLWVEVNTERDLNGVYSEEAYPTPPYTNNPSWDYWSSYGYAYRGQPSVVYSVPIHLDTMEGAWTTGDAIAYGDLHGVNGGITPLDASITNDPVAAPGSGADRLRRSGQTRIAVSTPAIEECAVLPMVPAIGNFTARHDTDRKHSHEWGRLTWNPIAIEGEDALDYTVKVSTRPILTDQDFVQAEDAKAASTEIQGLNVCPVDMASGTSDCPPAGTPFSVDIGRLNYQTHYYVAIRASGPCGSRSPIATTEFDTTAIYFTTVAPCFVATAAHGSAMAPDVQTLRDFRNHTLVHTPTGRAFVRGYYAVGPRFANIIARSRTLQTLARAILRPFVQATTFTPH